MGIMDILYKHDYIVSPVPGPISRILLKTAENVSINHGNSGTVVYQRFSILCTPVKDTSWRKNDDGTTVELASAAVST